MKSSLYPRFHDDSWWVYAEEFDSDTGPYSTEEQAQEWIDSIRNDDVLELGDGAPMLAPTQDLIEANASIGIAKAMGWEVVQHGTATVFYRADINAGHIEMSRFNPFKHPDDEFFILEFMREKRHSDVNAWNAFYRCVEFEMKKRGAPTDLAIDYMIGDFTRAFIRWMT